jgi:acetylornithine deacetylase/succinyl-diaminopimelate desuccinylase-like protein
MMQEVLTYVDAQRQSYVERLVELLKFPSISADPAYKKDILACGQYLEKEFAALGLKTELISTAGNPIVYAEYSRPENKRTLLIYGHYDVQPVDPLDLWERPPFEPQIKDDRIYARGASDDKGQLLIHLLAAEAYLKTVGSLPINIKFVIEGEEETAADNLEIFIKENHDKLKADGVIVSDTAMYGPDLPAITYGLRGIAATEIKITGPDRDLHSGSFGGSLANPATELARIIARLHDSDYHIAIDGFYEQVREIEDWEKQAFAELPFDEQAYLKLIGAAAPVGEKGFTTLERIWARPTCEVNGIFGGYSGEGGKTIVPSWAGAKITMRLVPDQDPTDILPKFEAFVRKIASPGVQLEFDHAGGAKPAIVSRDSFLVQAGTTALEKGFGRKPFFMREGGSIPIVNTFKEELRLDTLLLGFAQSDCNAHSPNENFVLSDFQRGIDTVVHLFAELG